MKVTKEITTVKAAEVEILQGRDMSDDLINDLDQVRKDIKEIAEIGKEAVKEAAELAFQSQHDKLYMALSSVMRSTVEANRELIDTHRSRQELTGSNATPDQITNNLFVGSTAELLDMLEKDKKK